MDFPKKVNQRIRKLANDYRTNHLSKGKKPILICPAMTMHPCNFIRNLDENLNTGDQFYKDFHVSYPNYEEDLKWSLKNVRVSLFSFIQLFNETIEIIPNKIDHKISMSMKKIIQRPAKNKLTKNLSLPDERSTSTLG